MKLSHAHAAWLVAAALGLPAMPAMASTDSGDAVTQSRSVTIADLNAADPAARATAYKRIDIAARVTCGFWTTSGVNMPADYNNCFNKAVTNGRAQADAKLASR